jgi:hypothetical protein
MNNTFQDQVIGIPINSGKFTVRRSPVRYLPGPDGQYPPALKKTKKDSILERMNKLGRKADSFANGVREHGNYISPCQTRNHAVFKFHPFFLILVF